VKVGFYCASASPVQGGGFSFVDTLRSGLLRNGALVEHHPVFYGSDSGGRLVRYDPAVDDDPVGFLAAINSRVNAAARGAALLGRGWRWSRVLKRDGVELLWSDGPDVPLAGVPFVVTIWDVGHHLLPFFPELGGARPWRVREGRLREVARRAAAVVVGTRTGRAQVRRAYGIDPARIRVLPLPVPTLPQGAEDPVDVHRRWKIRAPYLLYPAQYWPHKNHIVLLRAMALLAERGFTDFELVLTGSDKGNLAFVRATASEMGLASRVRFLGFVSRSELAGLYSAAAALTFPSLLGPDNLPPLEAFSVGCPVVAAEVPGASEQLGAGARLVPPTSAEAWAVAIEEVLGGGPVVSERVTAGKAIAAARGVSAYIQGIRRVIDEFEPYRACWPR
jgi:glycosyltransferase involved in cell wall biosynthesis